MEYEYRGCTEQTIGFYKERLRHFQKTTAVTQFESQLLEGRCKAEQVEHYLETLAQQAREKGIKGVVVLDNAGFHKAKRIKQQLDCWQSMG